MDVSIAEAGNDLSRLIRALEAGEQIIITRNGKPVAQLAPPHLGADLFASAPCAVASGSLRGGMTQ
jgi:prevent-host-death family protein